MKYLVTGSSGHLGEALIRTLRQNGESVQGLDILPGDYTDLVGSVTDADMVHKAVSGVDHILHTATLHKPHVKTHSKQQFIDTNITGTLRLLEAAAQEKIRSFVFTSTTSTFGAALTPHEKDPAAWITEEVIPIPKNIYGVTKTAAEDICQLIQQQYQLPCVILRTSRFFPEADDQQRMREAYADANLKANEFLFRRVDIEDVVSAHLLAAIRAPEIGFDKYIISASNPFSEDDLIDLHRDAPHLIARKFPNYPGIYAKKGWKMFPTIDRVYVNGQAITDLEWKPKYDFGHVLKCLESDEDFRSPLAMSIGTKGYHAEPFAQGPYPV